MKWQPMKTAPMDGRLVWVTLESDGKRWRDKDCYPYEEIVIAWMPIQHEPTPYTGTLEELDAEGGDA